MIEINMIFVNNKIERNASYLPASETIHRLEDWKTIHWMIALFFENITFISFDTWYS